jgi:hypothetical protein
MKPNDANHPRLSDSLYDFHTRFLDRNFVHCELTKVINKDAFAARFVESLGSEIHGALESEDLADENLFDSFFFSDYIDYLYSWINRSDGFDPNWLVGEDGILRDDRGEVYEDGIPNALNKQSQLAALGIYFIEDIDGMGYRVFDDSGNNPHGFSIDMWDCRNASYLIMAFKCLVYCQRLQLGEVLNKDEEEQAKKFDVEAFEKSINTKRAKNAALAKIAIDSDGKQAAKSEIRTEWEKWQKNPKLYKGKAAFARAMLDKHTNLESHRVIERWGKEWSESS